MLFNKSCSEIIVTLQQRRSYQRLFLLMICMKKLILLFTVVLFTAISFAQPEDVKTLHETAKTFMRSGDFDNAIIVLNRALQQDSKNLELQKDLVMSFYLKRDFEKALEGVKVLTDRDDADVVTYQIAGNVYKALEEAKECEKLYKKAIKKFPNSGPLLSEYGELLWAIKDFNAINYWERGIKEDPGYGGNYYNAAMFYFYTKDKVWSLIYGEIFVNMESLSERGTAMKELLLKGYKEKLFSDADVMTGQEKTKSEFAKNFLSGMAKQSALTSKGINTEVLTMIRTRFILDWFETNGAKFPFKLFEYHRQLLSEGMFEAYNQWLFGPGENLAAYDNWTKTHSEEYYGFNTFQRSRVFRMPQGQYYQVN
jgi:tetratricopeptide (TPR) repeat protein